MMIITRGMIKSFAVIALISASLLSMSGCGDEDDADTAGCPSGTYLANATDTLTMPADGDDTILSPFGSPYPGGGAIHLTPLVVTVTDVDGVPRNNICVRFYSDGIWYTDDGHTTLASVGANNSVVAVTNNHGVITLYWSTYNLPAANFVTVDATATPPTYTSGADITGDSFIQAYSGALSGLFIETWTVQGEQAPN